MARPWKLLFHNANRGHKEVMVAHVIPKVWEKNLLPLQGVKILLKSVEADAIILYEVLCTTLPVNWTGLLFMADYQALTKHIDFPLPVLTERDCFKSLLWYLLYTKKENLQSWKMMD